MLEYIKMILEKVSFDSKLFEKELMKGMKQLVPTEVNLLKEWCYEKYGGPYKALLNKIFRRSQFI
ncbi:hypothetical protein DJ013_06050 [Arcticibacterium luteifluviistationis]|uniref:Uncharacterized protein n=1 Tax=Arcticibacterium luteifluviistationis TaxID=1784714 RepID=A0A2Z4G972_9BACT|nr:hypothetical protein DJ013_06050 [Arcticibacterium luteifluviistationis]